MDSFDSFIHRRNTDSLKWDRNPSLEPYWVADMDFASPPAVIEALQQRVEHGVFGYALPPKDMGEVILSYLKKRHGVDAKEEWIVHLGGLVPALSLATRAFGAPGDSLMTMTPIYPPFLGVHSDGHLDLITVPHCFDSLTGLWTFDWDKLEHARRANTKIFLLSNPQNPLGRAFSREELEKLAAFCQRHDLILISDEIHCDLILEEERTPHVSALSLQALQDCSVTLLAPSKTYNIAGLGYAFAVIPNQKLRNAFLKAKGYGLPEINALAYSAARAAYLHGEGWRQQLLAYLRGNYQLLRTMLHRELPKMTLPNLQATYLAWIDASAYHEHPAHFLEKKAGLFVSDGSFFGAPKGHFRWNFGTSSHYLQRGLESMIHAFHSLD